MSQRSSRATPSAKKAKRSKHDELNARPPPLRGDEAKERIHAMHVAAEQRYELQIAHRSGAAARHNVKAESVVVGKKEARRRAQQERKAHLENDMAAHDERHKSEMLRRSAKGSAVSAGRLDQPSPCVPLPRCPPPPTPPPRIFFAMRRRVRRSSRRSLLFTTPRLMRR